MDKEFESYWEQYGELHASMCNGNIKQFAKEIWLSGHPLPRTRAEVLVEIEAWCKKETEKDNADNDMSNPDLWRVNVGDDWITVESKYPEDRDYPDWEYSVTIGKSGLMTAGYEDGNGWENSWWAPDELVELLLEWKKATE